MPAAGFEEGGVGLAAARFGVTEQFGEGRRRAQRREPRIAGKRGAAQKPVIDHAVKKVDGLLHLTDLGKLAPHVELALQILLCEQVSGFNRVETFLKVAFEIGSERVHEGAKGTGNGARFFAVAEFCERGPSLAKASQRSTVEVEAGLCIVAIERLLILAEEEVSVRHAGDGVGIEMTGTKMSGERGIQLVAIPASLNEAGEQLRIVAAGA